MGTKARWALYLALLAVALTVFWGTDILGTSPLWVKASLSLLAAVMLYIATDPRTGDDPYARFRRRH